MADRKEYMRKLMAAKRGKPANTANTANKPANKAPEPVSKSVSTIPWITDADLSMFDGHGRGEPVNGLVMVARRSPTLVRGEYTGELVGVLPETVWRQRLDDVCAHGFHGWACKPCLA